MLTGLHVDQEGSSFPQLHSPTRTHTLGMVSQASVTVSTCPGSKLSKVTNLSTAQ